MWRDFKYIIAYLVPLAVFWGINTGGIWSFSGFFLSFGIIPFVEYLTPAQGGNLDEAGEQTQLNKFVFDWLLYLNVPILWGILAYLFYTLANVPLELYEIAGMTLSVGILCGGFGINVGHELGHRDNAFDRVLSKMLLIPSHYLHFLIEHNLGHHKWVSTEKDPASSRLNENIYSFFVRSVVGGYRSAWAIETKLLEKNKIPFFHFKNRMLQFALIQFVYLALVFWAFGALVLIAAVVAGIIGFLSLETVNYIEHYGLRRKLLPSGRYESVKPWHSWNSNHDLGRIFLYELTRHSDHHYKANRKFQILRHFEESPQLRFGYPGSMLMALIPPLWFQQMNPLVEAFNKKSASTSPILQPVS